MYKFTVNVFALTDIGRMRENNEDMVYTGGEKVKIYAVCDGMGGESYGEIASEIAILTEKAVRGGLTEDETSGGVITLCDKCGSGVYAFTPIINQPEAAILGIGGVYQRLVMTHRGIENKYFVMLSLTFDYRIVNGTEAEDFQLRLKELLENPKSIL